MATKKKKKKSKVHVQERIPNGDDGLGWGGSWWFIEIDYKGGRLQVGQERTKKAAETFADILRSLEE